MSPSNPPAHLDDFSLSPFLLLPDSFGDIYAGETFSAYIAVVNGYPQIPFQNVSLAVRFQSATTVIDLADVRADPNVPNSPRTLTSNDTFDMIVKQTLTELGVHTLRVSVQYMLTPYGEPKPLRKFYRFNVQQPLVTQSSYREIDGLPMIQCEVTNATKAPIFLDQLTYIPAHKGSLFRAIETGRATTAPTTATTTPPSSLAPLRDCPDLQDQLKILAPGESYAFSFRFTHYPDLSGRSPGFPQVRWCTSMSEYSTYRGENSVKKALGVEGAGVGGAGVSVGVGLGGVGAAGAVQDAGWIKYQCLERPGGGGCPEAAQRITKNHIAAPRLQK
ncbi:hypothetical protein B484DRAFT_69098 [Ochromonadaceae sp. CCMP2298]|nr:hypothetical protein B484DRAFT_69098 [Ochromonadaceae sp. CCMP2298]